MGYLILVLSSFVLLGAFVALTRYEARRGVRVFAERRESFDRTVTQATFVLAHVDLAAFAASEMRRALQIIGHEAAHLSLRAVRFAERLLTRLVRNLRSANEHPVQARGNTREFVRTLTDFKENLRANQPSVGGFEV
jgi:hypothetical protein